MRIGVRFWTPWAWGASKAMDGMAERKRRPMRASTKLFRLAGLAILWPLALGLIKFPSAMEHAWHALTIGPHAAVWRADLAAAGIILLCVAAFVLTLLAVSRRVEGD